MKINKSKLITYLVLILPAIFVLWIYLFTFYSLTCRSLEVFDNAQTRMRFPFSCEASINGGEYKNFTYTWRK